MHQCINSISFTSSRKNEIPCFKCRDAYLRRQLLSHSSSDQKSESPDALKNAGKGERENRQNFGPQKFAQNFYLDKNKFPANQTHSPVAQLVERGTVTKETPVHVHTYVYSSLIYIQKSLVAGTYLARPSTVRRAEIISANVAVHVSRVSQLE